MKYIKLFQNHSSYIAYIDGGDASLPNVSTCLDDHAAHYKPNVHDYSKDYFTTVALDGGNISFVGSWSSNTLSYKVLSSAGGGGTDWSTPSSSVTVNVTQGDKVLWKGETTPLTNNGIGTFTSTAQFNVEGNVMSLLFGDDFKGQTDLSDKRHAFNGLFSGNTQVVNAENLVLPATTLAEFCYMGMFSRCSSLTAAPELPATTLAETCYANMFDGCTSLTKAPQLLADTLANYCYYDMFNHCTSLTTAPQLPATTLADNCYDSMFWSCTSLTTAPELPATTLAKRCYGSMFAFCTSLATAPELPVKTLSSQCYANMFRGCTSLTTAPKLPATTLADNCYESMFIDCTSLTTAPELPAMTLTNFCYSKMFNGCTSLTAAPQLPAKTLANFCYSGMFSNCTSLATARIEQSLVSRTFAYSFNENSNVYITSLDTSVIPSDAFFGNPKTGNLYFNSGSKWITDDDLLNQFIGWKYYVDGEYIGIIEKSGGSYYNATDFSDCFATVALSSGNIVFSGSRSSTVRNQLSYSNDGGSTWSTPSNSITVSVSEGDKVLWKGECTPIEYEGIGTFHNTSTARFNVEGNVMSLLYGDNFQGQTDLSGKQHALNRLFSGNMKVVSAANLELPATTLAENCYYDMFNSCTSLTAAPKLPATTLVSYCYSYMFDGCTSLTAITCLATDISASNCTTRWVRRVASTGTFTKAASMTSWTTGSDGIPANWTVQDY